MSSKLSPLAALKGAVRAFFRHDLTFQRSGSGLRMVLADPALAGQPRPPTRAEKMAQKEQRDLELAREELARLLDEDASLRTTMRHLAFVEHALGRKGWRALYKVPQDALQKALQQLEGLVTNWSPVGLACLRSKMAVAVVDREHQDESGSAFKTSMVHDSPPALAAQAIENAKASAAAAEDDEDAALIAAYAALGVAAPADAQAVVGGAAPAVQPGAGRQPALT